MNKKPIALSGQSLSQRCRERLTSLGFEVVILQPYTRLGKGVQTHADLMLLPVENKIFIYEELYGRYRELLSTLTERGYEIVTEPTPPAQSYPEDIALNCLVIGKNIFCKKKHTSVAVREFAEQSGYRVVNTNQGYARCTACPVADRGIISADPSMLKAAEGIGVETLSIVGGYVMLDGFEYGFIGGSCGYYNNTLYFAGDISKHPHKERIEDFCAARGVNVVSLSDEPLADVGSIFFF